MSRSLGLFAGNGGAIRFSGSALVDLSALERAYVDFVVNRCGGNVSRAARALGLDRRTLQRKRARWMDGVDLEDTGLDDGGQDDRCSSVRGPNDAGRDGDQATEARRH
jgi:hypothetical protein